MLSVVALVNPYKGIVVPVAPRQSKAKQRKILIFNENRDFLFSQKTQKSAVHDHLWAQRKIPVVFNCGHKIASISGRLIE